MNRGFRVGDKVVERVQHYALGACVVVVGQIVGTCGADYLVTGLRLPGSGPGEPIDWGDPHLFDGSELRRFRPSADKPYLLGRVDLGLLREREELPA